MKKISLTLFSIFSIYSCILFGQIEPIACGTTTASGSEATSWGRYKTAQTGSGEYFRVLIVFAQFASDATSNSDWPLNQLPNWANSFIASSVSSNYADETISDYFDEASLDKFNFIGDVYQDTIIIPTNMSYGNANEYVLEELNDSIPDFTRYDNWGLVSGDHVFSEGNGDGYLDMLIIIYRSANHFPSWGGIANLNISPQYTTHDDVIINGGTSALGSEITSKAGLSGKFVMINHIAHEFGHYLFGGGHTDVGGLMLGVQGDGYGSYYGTSYMMGAWERIKLGYVTPTDPSTDGEQITLDDFVTTGECIRINVNSTTYFAIENHQRLSKYDQISRGGPLEGQYSFTSDLDNGIHIWLVTNGTSWVPDIEAKTADGLWDWILDGTISMPSGWPTTMPLTNRDAVNRNSGKSDKHPRNIYWSSDWWQKWHDINPSTGEYELTRDCMGDGNDAFNLDFNELFTPWSNPSSYASGTTNISVELVSKSGNDITVKVYSTSSSAKNLAPSKPQNLDVTSVSNHPYLTWEANIEPDLIGYYIWRKENSGAWYNIDFTSSTNYTDTEVTTFQQVDTYQYKITAADSSAKSSVYSDIVEIEGIMPKININEEKTSLTEFSLLQNYPNPFNPATAITYNIPKYSFVTLKVYDVLGKEIANLVNETKEAGSHSIEFNASNLPSGVYFYKITAGNFLQIRKMLLLK